MEHSFDVNHAKKYGVECAVFIRHLQFWIIKNRANGKNRKPIEIDGEMQYRTFTYNSAHALNQLFPYLSESQIYRIVTKLKKNKVIVVGKFNDNPYDKTNWYAFVNESEYMIDEYEPDTDAEVGKEGESFKPSQKFSMKKNTPADKTHVLFEIAWKKYGARGSKMQAKTVWNKMSDDDKNLAVDGVGKFIINNPDPKYRPHFCRYLSHRRWEDEYEEEPSNDGYDLIGGTNEKDIDDDDFN